MIAKCHIDVVAVACARCARGSDVVAGTLSRLESDGSIVMNVRAMNATDGILPRSRARRSIRSIMT